MGAGATFGIENLGKDVLVLSGEVSTANVMLFITELTARPCRLSQDLVLDMAELFFADGIAILLTINALRSLALRVNSLRLQYPSEPMHEGLLGNGVLDEPGLRIQLVCRPAKLAAVLDD
ncbi:MAG: hypothetical protein OEW58_10800 [Gammaproteobacteria bacterium]|nr:hypothetical protein [Gammaproteobacteria bacterium]